MNSAEVLIKFKGDTTNSDKAIKGTTASLGQLTKAFTLGSLATKGISKGLELITGNLDSAISRIDTMNNFSTVMQNLGISVEDSNEVIKTLSEELVGLPTTLNSAATSVQRLTSYNGDIKKSEQYFLAMNNAIIAGTNDAGMQATAMEQLTQAYTKGKPDLQDWKSLLQAMPAQLKQVSIAMGYMQTDKLYEALKNGEISMNDFMDTLVKLNSTGVEGFASLEEQARANTAGIGTSITNMRTAFVRGVGGIVTSIDEALTPLGGLSGIINSIGKIGEKVFKELGFILGDTITLLMEASKDVMPQLEASFQELKPTLTTLAKTLFPAIAKVLKKIMPSVLRIVEKAMPLAIKMLESMIPLIEPLADLLAAHMELFITNLEIMLDLWVVVMPPIIKVLTQLTKSILPALTAILKTETNLIKGIKSTISNLVDFIVTLPQTILDIIDSIVSFITIIPDTVYDIGVYVGNILREFITSTLPSFINGVINWFAQLPGNLWSIITNAVNTVINVFTSLPGNIWNIFTSVIGKITSLANGIINAAWIALPRAVDTVVGFFADLPNKMLQIGKDMVTGLWNGISGAKDWIGSKISGFGKGLVNGFKNALGIHSPSVVMKKEIGINMGLGVIEGIDDTENQINKAVGNITSGITANIGGFNGSNMSSMQSSNITPIVNVYADFKTDPLGQTVSNIKTFSGGAKNDYNYGVGV